MEAEPVADLPAGDEWLYEPKWDGYRCLAFRDGGHVCLAVPNGKPISTATSPSSVAASRAGAEALRAGRRDPRGGRRAGRTSTACSSACIRPRAAWQAALARDARRASWRSTCCSMRKARICASRRSAIDARRSRHSSRGRRERRRDQISPATPRRANGRRLAEAGRARASTA